MSNATNSADSRNKSLATRVITGKVRLSYAFIWEPQEDDDGVEKYSTSFLIPKEDTETFEKIKAAVLAARKLGKEKKWGNKLPKDLRFPVRDGDVEVEENDKEEAYRGHWFINATSKRAPEIVDRKRQPITDPDKVYSGCYVRLSVNFYPYDHKGNKGIACGLNNIQFIADGEPLGAVRVKAENDFDEWIDGDDDLDFGSDDDVSVSQSGKKTGDTFDDDDDIDIIDSAA